MDRQKSKNLVLFKMLDFLGVLKFHIVRIFMTIICTKNIHRSKYFMRCYVQLIVNPLFDLKYYVTSKDIKAI